MAYTKQTWQDYPNQTTPVNAQRLNHIEDGLFNAAAEADKKLNTNQGVSQAGKFPRVGQDGNIEFVNPGGIIISQLDDIPDVNITNPTDGQVLSYDEENNEWVNADPTGGTEVIANPTLAGTESDLDGIQIGQTKYKVNKIDDSSTSATKVWSAQKVNSEVANLQSQIDDIQVGGGGSVIRVEFTEEEAEDSITFSMAGMDTITKTVPSVAPYIVEISTVEMGTMTITDTTISKSITLTIDTYELYAIPFASGFDFNEWLTLGNVTGTYASLEEVLADEKALRQLFNKHDSVDYLVECCESSLDADVETIVQTDLCAKWINLRDYALDTLYANEYIKTAMDEFDKYFYGELVEKDGEYVPKGTVPIMTSNNAPYGVATSPDEGGLSSFPTWKAFDGDADTNNDVWIRTSTTSYIQYQFVNPINVSRVGWQVVPTNDTSGASGLNATPKLQGSNDGVTFTDIGTMNMIAENAKTIVYADVNTDEYYMYLRVQFNGNNYIQGGVNRYCGFAFLQFYGRELKVSVPKMTSNNAPWGVASASDEHSTGTYSAYKAFDGLGNTRWATNGASSTEYIQYKFTNPTCVRKVYVRSATPQLTAQVRGSNDGNTWESIGNPFQISGTETDIFNNIDNDNHYLYYQLYLTNVVIGTGASLYTLQFYGLDYSEHTERHWIYDHGVEVETLTSYTSGNGVINKQSDSLYMKVSNGQISVAEFYTNKIDVTDYSLVRANYGNEALVYSTYGGFQIDTLNSAPMQPDGTGRDAFASATSLPYNSYLDISASNGEKYLNVASSAWNDSISMTATVTEWWLE